MKLTRNRFLTARGFGVHSPWAYNFIVDVLGEKHPYYAYEDLYDFWQSAPQQLPQLNEKTDQMLFRIVNHLLPLTIVEIGAGAGVTAGYLASVSTDIDVISIDSNHPFNEAVKQNLSIFGNVSYQVGNQMELLRAVLKGNNGKTLFHIAHTAHYADICELLLQNAMPDTAIVVQGLNNTLIYKWWANIIKDDRVGETYETKTTGILLFDKKKYKQHYRL